MARKVVQLRDVLDVKKSEFESLSEKYAFNDAQTTRTLDRLASSANELGNLGVDPKESDFISMIPESSDIEQLEMEFTRALGELSKKQFQDELIGEALREDSSQFEWIEITAPETSFVRGRSQTELREQQAEMVRLQFAEVDVQEKLAQAKAGVAEAKASIDTLGQAIGAVQQKRWGYGDVASLSFG